MVKLRAHHHHNKPYTTSKTQIPSQSTCQSHSGQSAASMVQQPSHSEPSELTASRRRSLTQHESRIGILLLTIKYLLSPLHSYLRYTNRDLLQLVHSGILLLTSAVAPKNTLASGLLVAGMTMFSGSIYLLVLDPQRFKSLGPITPLGGLCLIGGWAALAFGKRIPFPR